MRWPSCNIRFSYLSHHCKRWRLWLHVQGYRTTSVNVNHSCWRGFLQKTWNLFHSAFPVSASIQALFFSLPFVFQRRHYQLRGVLTDPGDSGGEEGRRDGDAEEGQDTAARRQENGKAQGQAAHGRRAWVQRWSRSLFPAFVPPARRVTRANWSPFQRS